MEFLSVGEGAHVRRIALEQREGKAPGLFWLGGFKSDMAGSKASALDMIGKKTGLGVTRFDYSGHGQSEGAFLEGTISDWLEECIAVFLKKTRGEQILVGSSMGGWLALLLNRYLQNKDEGRVKALVLIAPAVDMTQDLMRAAFTPEELEMLEKQGRIEQPSDYDEPYILTKKLIEDGEKHLLFSDHLATGCPVHILQGGRDEAVPVSHAQKLVSHLLLDPVTLTLVPDGDHSLSREQDLELLERTIIQAAGAESRREKGA
ncbi:MAG TPA: alpha/beta hydrolase [Devosia sp.]|nr:alpha/beta hydrolase [Devosia sp.]